MVEVNRNTLRGTYRGFSRPDQRFLSVYRTRRTAQHKSAPRAVRADTIESMMFDPGAKAKQCVCKYVGSWPSNVHADRSGMKGGRFFCLFDVDGPFRHIDCNHFANGLSLLADLIPVTNVSLLFRKIVAINRELSIQADPLEQ